MNIPEGYKLVPTVPTTHMIAATVADDQGAKGLRAKIAVDAYSAMLAAAPTPLQPIYSALNFVCTALPGPGNECAFVELENDAGESLGHGEWRNRDDGFVELHIAAPQPIYDETKERELFAEFSRRIVAHDAANFPIRWCDCVSDEEIEENLNTWLACAQSRAKAGEVGHE